MPIKEQRAPSGRRKPPEAGRQSRLVRGSARIDSDAAPSQSTGSLQKIQASTSHIALVDGLLRDRGLMAMAQSEGEKLPALDALAMEVRLTLAGCADGVRGQIDQRLQQVGLTRGKYNVMMILRDSPTGRLSMGDIADLVVTSPRNVTALVDSLEAAGLVRRYPSKTDRRVTLIGLSRAGDELLREFLPELHRFLDSFFQSFTTEEVVWLLHGLNKLRLGIARR